MSPPSSLQEIGMMHKEDYEVKTMAAKYFHLEIVGRIISRQLQKSR